MHFESCNLVNFYVLDVYRKDSSGMKTIRVPAVRIGNMENPPDDGYTWRKYGQKDILGSIFPR